MTSPSKTNLIVVNEKQRKNRFISSVFMSRATIFHPSSSLTPTMKSKLIEVAQNGGTNPNTPLESIKMNSADKNFRIDLHSDYLLQPHRDILDTTLAYAQIIKLDDVSYNAGKKVAWSEVYQMINNDDQQERQADSAESLIDTDATILSMSLYELAERLGVTTTPTNIERITRNITQLATAHLVINELDDKQQVIKKRPLSFIQDYRFCCDRSRLETNNNSVNHVFLIPDKRLLQAIRDDGYFYRLDQQKIFEYSKPSTRSFLKYITSYRAELLHQKSLEWALERYLLSIASKVSHNFRNNLRQDLLDNSKLIEDHFGLQFRDTDTGQKIFYTGLT
ncbi:DNA mismatch repair protein [Vibrio chagasii]|uniref:DNA mismatch repair protein n=1 Tax=Vibrio chagasii TaxID=170679 RepID=UPI003DA00BC0